MNINRIGPAVALSCLFALPAGSALAECSLQRTANAELMESTIILAQADSTTTGNADEKCEPGEEGCTAESGEDKQDSGTTGADGNTQSEGGGNANESDSNNRNDGNTQSEGGGDAGESGGGNDGGGDGGGGN